MKRLIPHIRISYSWLLAGAASEALNDKYGGGIPLRSFDEYQQVADQYREWWSADSDKILSGLCSALDLEFRQNIIDVYIAPWFNPISDPMVIGPAFQSKEALVNTVTHELIHRLLTDNTAIESGHDFLSDWKKLFGDHHDWNTLVHIPVHAVIKKLYPDIMDRPDLLKFDIEDTKNNPPYANAWKYVEENDYQAIVDSLSISKPL